MALSLPKPRPHKLVKEESDAQWQRVDRMESDKVKARSKGQCEVIERGLRCDRRAFEVHHHIGGWKRRGRGASAFAENKTHCCSDCHADITGNVLEHLGGNRYRRVL